MLRQWLGGLRLRLRAQRPGQRGGAGLQHRSIWSLRLPKRRLASGLLIALAFTLLLALTKQQIAAAWGQQLIAWMHALGLPGQFVLPTADSSDFFSLPVPLIDVQLRDLGMLTTATHALVVLLVWELSGWLPDAAKPLSYLLRFAVLIHAAAIVYFWFWPARFLHPLSNHVAGGLRQAWALMLVTPWLHLCMYYIFPFAVWQRVALTAVTLLFLFVLTPLQYASHVALVYQLGLIMSPLLYLLFGVMVPMLGLVALYGWGMSWHRASPAAEA